MSNRKLVGEDFYLISSNDGGTPATFTVYFFFYLKLHNIFTISFLLLELACSN